MCCTLHEWTVSLHFLYDTHVLDFPYNLAILLFQSDGMSALSGYILCRSLYQLSSSGYVALSSVLPQNPSLNSIQQLRGVPVIAPLWLQGDGRFSRVQHQLHTDAATLKQASDYIQAHPDASDLQPEFVLKVTWSGVRESPAGQEAADSGLRDVGVSCTSKHKTLTTEKCSGCLNSVTVLRHMYTIFSNFSSHRSLCKF